MDVYKLAHPVGSLVGSASCDDSVKVVRKLCVLFGGASTQRELGCREPLFHGTNHDPLSIRCVVSWNELQFVHKSNDCMKCGDS